MNQEKILSREAFAQPAEVHPFYQVPVNIYDTPQDAFLTEGPEIKAIPITGGPHLQFFSRVMPSKRIRIVFHGAVRAEVDQYPRFDRVGTSMKTEDSFLSFADPTLTLDDSIRLGWYTGCDEWDPENVILNVISEAIEKSGASEVIFIGGSAGGFAAMKYGAKFKDSLVFAFSPQTAINKYRGGSFPSLLKAGYKGITAEEALEKYPRRFENVDLYASGEYLNKLFYLQNITDLAHITDHYLPFARSFQVGAAEGELVKDRIKLVLVDQEREGHGPPTSTEFEKYFKDAIEFGFSSEQPENVSSEIVATDKVGNLEQRFENIEKKLKENSDQVGRIYRALNREIGKLPWDIEVLRRLSTSYIPEEIMSVPPVGSFAVRTTGVQTIVELMQSNKPKTIVECGSGSSTAWFALAAQKNGRGHVYSFEHEEEFLNKTQALIDSLGLSEFVTLIHSPLEAKEEFNNEKWYSTAGVDNIPSSIDLLFVDGPPASVGYGARRHALTALQKKMTSETLLIVDDANRPAERAMVKDWVENNGYEIYKELSDSVVLKRGKHD